MLLVPLTLFSGVEQAFVVGLYTKAYIGCGLGIGQIGFVMTGFGVADAVCSLVFGPLMKLFGRMPLFVFGAVISMLVSLTLLIWPLNPGDTSLFYAIVGVLGMADGVWNTQISGLWIALSSSHLEAAFANYRFWESTGFGLGLILIRFTNITQFLLISLGMLLIGMLCYLSIEFYDNISLHGRRMVDMCRIRRKKQLGNKPLSSMETSLISATSAPEKVLYQLLYLLLRTDQAVNSNKVMFASTLDHTEAFLKSICCDQWTCVNTICDGKSFPLCPQCLLPVGLQHVKSATFADQLFQNLLSLKKTLSDFTIFQFDRQIMLSLVETDKQRRTVEEFCSTQECAKIKDGVNHMNIDEEPDELPLEQIFGKELNLPVLRTTVSNDNVLDLVSLSGDVTPSTKIDDTVIAGTSIQNDIVMTQQLRVYDEPEKFQFFKEPPRNTFGRIVAKKRMPIDSEHGLKNRGAKNLNAIPLKTTIAQNSHKSPFQRYEYNLVNAAIRGSKKRLLEALENGEDANESDNLGFTALYHAAAHNYTEICKILIENGALINAHGGELCETPLHAAVRWQAVDVVEYLLSKGANRRARNLKDETPMDFIKDDEMQAVFGRIPHPIQMVYPSRKSKKYSIFLSTTLPNLNLEHGKLLFSDLLQNTMNLENATHLVIQAAENRAAEISVEILEAMLRGQYILTSEWLSACLEANDIVDEEMYEISTIIRNGQLLAKNSCSTARKNYARMKPELFRGCHFYFCKHKYLPYRENEVKKLVRLAGGVILGREPKMEEYIESGLKPYHARAGNDLNELFGLFVVYMPGQSIPQRVAKQKFISLITPIWIMECIAKFTLLRPEDQ
ncbi:unnamed protein product [Wuchereria bancrofti]|uniref:BRCT domain-containing protein n=2 Tax=Wuchereria bancrofti TaxID=6293 RepID=A0A3P7GHZ1_WUCBA|nr:unnamed protein product [Wuchereria bancrofti]